MLITKGTQAEVINQVEGKVFETLLENAALTNFKTKYLVVNTSRQNDRMLVRYISNEPAAGSQIAIASLEDAYLYLTHNNN